MHLWCTRGRGLTSTSFLKIKTKKDVSFLMISLIKYWEGNFSFYYSWDCLVTANSMPFTKVF